MESKNNEPKTILRIIASDEEKLPSGTMVELKIGKNGKATVVGEPVPFPKDKVVED